MLPLHRNDGMEPKRRLAYATEIANFYRMQIVAKKNLGSGAKRECRSGFRKQDIFFLWPYYKYGDISISYTDIAIQLYGL